MSGRGAIGKRIGGKGTWRRKAKKVIRGANIEGEKFWAAAQRLGCRPIGDIDSAAIIFAEQDDALSFKQPNLALDIKANTFVLQGTPEKKPMVEVLTDWLSSMNLGLQSKPADEQADDLGDVAEDVDFSKADEETPKEEEN